MKCVKKVIILFLLCLVLTNSTGCWDNRDITDVSIVSAIGIDKTSDNKIEYTVQIIKPDTISAQAQGSSDDATWTFSIIGETVFEAGRNILSTVNLKMLLSFSDLIVVGEEIAKESILDVLDFFKRDHETNRRGYVLIAKGITAKEVINAKSELESIPAFHIVSSIENTKASPTKKEITIIDVLIEMSSPGINPVIGVIQTIGGKKGEMKVKDLKVEGGAAFKKDKLVGWLDPIETRGYLFVVDEFKNGIINIPNPQDMSKRVSIEVKKAKSEIDVQLDDGQPVLLIDLKIECNIGEQQGSGDLTMDDMVKEVEKEIVNSIEAEIKNTVKLAQKEFNSDIFGFGKVMHRKYLDFWDTVKDNWDSEFAKAAVEIKVEATVKQSGLIKDPVEPK